MLNKQKGNMYPWVSHTWNPIKGKCPHGCSYCYMKGFPQKELHLDDKELKTNLGKSNFIFVGSSTDMWAEDVPEIWIKLAMLSCNTHRNEYLFQSKNPERFSLYKFPIGTILGTTIETNRWYPDVMGKATWPVYRGAAMSQITLPKMVSIEPIMDFDLDILAPWIKLISPQFVSIGADSKGHKLPEPSPDKIKALISALQEFTEVKIKANLSRITDRGSRRYR